MGTLNAVAPPSEIAASRSHNCGAHNRGQGSAAGTIGFGAADIVRPRAWPHRARPRPVCKSMARVAPTDDCAGTVARSGRAAPGAWRL